VKAFDRPYSMVLRFPRWSLAVFVLVLLGLVTRGDFSNGDTPRRLQVTHWLWTDQPQVNNADHVLSQPTRFGLSNPGWCELPGRNGEIFAQFGLGQSLIMLPGDVLSWWLVERLLVNWLPPSRYAGDVGGQYQDLRATIVNLATFPALCALSVILSYDLLLLLGFLPRIAMAATILFTTATTFLVYMQNVQENGLAYLCYVAALVFTLRASKHNWKTNLIIAGAFSGFSLLIKLSDAAYLGPVFLLALFLRLENSDESDINFRGIVKETSFVSFYYGIPLLAFVAIDRYYQFYRFGELLTTYMTHCVEYYSHVGYPTGYPFGYDFLSGFLGPFITRNHSMFLFDPFLLVALVYASLKWPRMTLRQRLVLVGAAWALISLTLIFAGTYFWTGGLDWGPRHHLVPVEVICLLGFAFVLRDFSSFKPWIRTLIILNLLIAGGSQMIALPLLASVELRQIELGDPIGSVQLMRVRNLYHLAVGDFERIGLGYGSPVILRRVISKDTDQLLFFRLATAMPRVSYLLYAAWLILLLSAMTAGVTIVARATRPP
jgi:Dolichyl-phosphate-mannose-protein mannosyltransferase